jgi:hypothetical protein
VSHPGCTLLLEKGPPVPTGWEAGWAPESVWTQRLQEKSFCWEYGVGQSTIYDIKMQKNQILQFVTESDSMASISKRKTLRGLSFSNINRLKLLMLF